MPAAPAPPPVAAEIFGDRLPLARRYADLLAGPAVVRGLVGPREAERVWERHVLNCAVLADLVPLAAFVADLGSGAGLPGVPLALARPDLRVDLIEPMSRRTSFLDLVLAELDLTGRVTVVRGRAQEHARVRPGAYDVVTARALAPLPDLVQLAAPLLRAGGLLLAIKGESVDDEIARLPQLAVSVHHLGEGKLESPTTVAAVACTGPSRSTRQHRRKERS